MTSIERYISFYLLLLADETEAEATFHSSIPRTVLHDLFIAFIHPFLYQEMQAGAVADDLLCSSVE